MVNNFFADLVQGKELGSSVTEEDIAFILAEKSRADFLKSEGVVDHTIEETGPSAILNNVSDNEDRAETQSADTSTDGPSVTAHTDLKDARHKLSRALSLWKDAQQMITMTEESMTEVENDARSILLEGEGYRMKPFSGRQSI